MKKSTFVYGVAIFGICMIIAVWLGGKWFNQARGHAKTVSVVGMAQRDFDSDLIVWRISYNVLNMDMKEGYTELKNINKTVREYLTSKGIADAELDFKAIETNKETDYHWDNNANRSYYTFLGYRLTQEVRIESQDVEKVEKISREITELLDKGIPQHLREGRPAAHYALVYSPDRSVVFVLRIEDEHRPAAIELSPDLIGQIRMLSGRSALTSNCKHGCFSDYCTQLG